MTLQLATCFLTTLSIFALTLLGAVPLGMVVYFGEKSHIAPIRWIIKIYISENIFVQLGKMLFPLLNQTDFAKEGVPRWNTTNFPRNTIR